MVLLDVGEAVGDADVLVDDVAVGDAVGLGDDVAVGLGLAVDVAVGLGLAVDVVEWPCAVGRPAGGAAIAPETEPATTTLTSTIASIDETGTARART